LLAFRVTIGQYLIVTVMGLQAVVWLRPMWRAYVVSKDLRAKGGGR
jgi:hypothetical protein